MHEVCIPYRIPRAWEQQGRNRYWNIKKYGRNVGMNEKSPKQGLTSAEGQTMML